MRKLTLFCSFLLLVSVSCTNNKNAEQGQEQKQEPIEDTTVAQEVANILSESGFTRMIADPNNLESWSYNGTIPCVVDFYATWCRPCKMMEPTFEKLAKEYSGRVLFYKIDVDQSKDLATKCGITGMPTLFFCNGKGLNKAFGYQEEAQLKALIEQMLQE